MKKLYIETYGCQMNVADSETIASIMQMADYDIYASEEEADAVFLNTCSVRDNAERKIHHRLDQLNALRKHGRKLLIGVLGCMAERTREELIQKGKADIVAGPDSYLSLPQMAAQAELGEKAMNVELSLTETYRNVIPRRIGGNRISGFVSITRGCNNFCHYCIVPYTRGRERSRDVESILTEVSDLQQRHYKEVTLLGQNVNSYRGADGQGHEVLFPDLLKMVAERVPDMRIRFTTSHPKDMSDDTLHAIAAFPNICRHIHLPVQSGSRQSHAVFIVLYVGQRIRHGDFGMVRTNAYALSAIDAALLDYARFSVAYSYCFGRTAFKTACAARTFNLIQCYRMVVLRHLTCSFRGY